MTRRRKTKPGNNGWWSEKQRIEAVTTWLATGNLTLTAAAINIPLDTVQRWRRTPWWNELVESIRSEENLQLDGKLAKVVNKSVDQLLDRVENGDFQYDQKTGQLVRKPISARDAAKVTTDMIDRRELLQGRKEKQVEGTKKVEEHLLKLAEEFKRFAEAKQVKGEAKVLEVTDA